MSLWKYLCGYVRISIKGAALERLINRAAAAGIRMWDVERAAGGALEASVAAGDFRRLRPFVRRMDCSVTVIGKRGLPFVFIRYRERPVLLWGWAVVLLGVIAASRFVWFIRVDGCSAVPESEIRMAIAASGVSVGTLRSDIGAAELGRYISGCDSRIAWAGAALTGVVLTVTVVESDLPPQIVAVDSSRSIFAAKPGVIVRVTALTGSPVVYEGAAVLPGELLISGSVGSEERPMTVAASGEVLARVAYTFVGAASVGEEIPVRSGAAEPFVTVELPFLTLGRVPGYDMSETEVLCETANRSALPFVYTRGMCYELVDAAVADGEQLAALALQRAHDAMLGGLPAGAELVSKTTRTTVLADGSVEVIITVETEEDIGVYGPITGLETDGTEHTGR